MTKGISEATDERGVTHHIWGDVRFVHLPKGRQRRNPAKRGYYVTRDGCRWWCTRQPIPANSRAAPGRTVDCMTCLVNPPERPRPMSFEGTATGRMSSKTIVMSAPSIFDANMRTHRVGRRR